MSQPGLSALLGRFPSRRFLQEHWPRTLLVQHGSPARLKGLIDTPELRDIDALTALTARQWLVQSARFKNRFGNVPVTGSAAAEFFHTGHTIYAVEPELHSEPFLGWLAALERDLELSAGLIRSSVFLSKPGPGSRMHFDAQESFVVQVRGRKRWWLAPNQDVQFPAENYIAGDPVPESLEVQLDRPLAQHMPDDAVSVVLEPGSIMFVPRGTWHATETLEESWHLDLMLPLPTWGDTMAARLAEHFHASAHWREPMLDATAFDARLALLTAELQAASPTGPARPTPTAARPTTAGSRRGRAGRTASKRRSTR